MRSAGAMVLDCNSAKQSESDSSLFSFIKYAFGFVRDKCEHSLCSYLIDVSMWPSVYLSVV